MSEPFDGKVKTPNRHFDPSRDHICPDLRSMNMKDMKSTTALEGQDGSDRKLVHGNRWQQIDGDVTTRIDGSLDTRISLNELREVSHNLGYWVSGLTIDNRVGTHHQTNWSTREDHFVHTRKEIHDQPQVIQQPTENVGWFHKHVERNWSKSTITGLNTALNGQKLEVTGSEASSKLIQVQYVGARSQNAAAEIKRNGYKLEFKKAGSKVAGPTVTVEAMRTEAAPTVNAAPTAEDGVHVI